MNVFRAHDALVRLQLTRFGATASDLDDLAQEVFLLVHGKREVLAKVRQVEPWLREICRRVTAGYRRKAYRRREIAFDEFPEAVDESETPEAGLEKQQDAERLHDALGRLDEKSRDLVALRELGNLPLMDVAAIVASDRKTVSKRLKIALRRLTTHFRMGPPLAKATVDTSPEVPGGARARASETASFQLLAKHPGIRIGLVGALVVTVWPGPVTVEALDLLDLQLARALDICQSCIVCLAVVEASARPPTLEGRRKIVKMLKAHANSFQAYATALLAGGGARNARPIMSGLAALARSPFPMRYFNGIEPAARWLTGEHGAASRTDLDAIRSGIRHLREL